MNLPRQTALTPCQDGTRLGLGGAPLGNLFEPVPDAQALELIHTAWEDGCRSFDTAPHYGHGLSERRMGDALRHRPRAKVCLSTKVGRLLTPDAHAPSEQHGFVQTLPFVQHWDYSGAGTERSMHDSLQRLGLARSRDGVAWEKLRSPILEGAPGAFDEELGEPAVWTSGGAWWMLYTGRAHDEQRRIGQIGRAHV